VVDLLPRPRTPGQILSVQARVVTNDLGEYRIPNITPSTYILRVNQSKSNSLGDLTGRTTYFPNSLDAGSATPLTVTAGQQVRADIRVVHRSGVRLAGRIVLPDAGDASSRASIIVGLSQPDPLHQFVSGQMVSSVKSGRFEFPELLPGTYTLTAVIRQSNQDILMSAVRQVQMGDQDVDDLSIDLRPPSDLSGSVSMTGRCPAETGRLMLSQLNYPHAQIRVESKTDGRFTITGLEPGYYRLEAMPGNTEKSTRVIAPQPITVQLGGRNVTKDGFEFPLTHDDPLSVTINCPSIGSQL
jgi:hypothetical protein